MKINIKSKNDQPGGTRAVPAHVRDCSSEVKFFLNTIVITLCVLSFLVFIWMLSYKYTHFLYEDWDFAFSSQSLWNLGNGQQYSSLFHRNFFGNHANFIAYLLVPIFKVFPHPFTLIVLKVLFFVAAAYVLYAMARNYLGPMAALFVMLLYLYYPPNVFGLLYEFDYENLVPLVLFGLICFFEKEKWVGFLILSLILILIKENLPTIIIAFGILGLFTKKNKLLWGVIPICLGGLSFYVLTSMVVPFFSIGKINQPHPYMHNYREFGASLTDVFMSILLHPEKILGLFLDVRRLMWLLTIFGPLCFLPLLSPSMMLLALPLLGQHFLSSNYSEQSISHYYVMTIAPFVFWGMVRVLARLRVAVNKIYSLLLVMVCLLSAGTMYSLKGSIADKVLSSGFDTPAYLVNFKAKMLKEIPRDSSVIATFVFLPELSLRSNLYAFFRVFGRDFNFDPPRQIESNIPGDLQYAYIDFYDPWIFHEVDSPSQYSNQLIQKFFQDNWSVKSAVENVVLFERKNDPLRLVEVSKEPFFKLPPTLNARIDHKITLLSVAKGVKLSENDAILPLTFYWKAEEQPEPANYYLMLQVKQNNRVLLARMIRIGYAIYPTKAWQSGDYIKEHYWLYAPGVDLTQANLVMEFLTPDAVNKKIFVENLGNAIVIDKQQLEVGIKDLSDKN